MNGVLVVDKPEGPTSHDVVARVRRATGERRIGHTGTLDPLATGVLALVMGRATRLAQFLASDRKTYLARVRFGAVSATYDREGVDADALEAAAARVPEIDPSALEAALAQFRGTFDQRPPAFSAKKVSGTRAYRLARAGEIAEVKPVPVRVDELALVARAGNVAELRVACSSGFYVRSLAHDLGQALGCGGFLEALRRTRAGDFTVEDAVPLVDIERTPDLVRERLVSMDKLLPSLPAVVLTARGAERASHGNALSRQDIEPSPASPLAAAPADRIRLLTPEGTLLGLASPDAAGLLHPSIVLV